YWLGLAFLDFAVQSAFLYGQRVNAITSSLNVVLALREKVYTQLHKLGLDYFAKAQTGDLTYRITQTIVSIKETFSAVIKGQR
ncbi:MAG: hypothetical protein AAFO84_15315, partial [Cyanobacteria bacterium J06598_1]